MVERPHDLLLNHRFDSVSDQDWLRQKLHVLLTRYSSMGGIVNSNLQHVLLSLTYIFYVLLWGFLCLELDREPEGN